LTAGGRSHGHQIFNDSDEEEIMGVLEAFSLANRGLSKQLVVLHLEKLRGSHGWDARQWLDGLIARHSERFQYMFTVPIDPKRVKEEVYEQTELFVNFFPSWFKRKKLSVNGLFNADETRVKLEKHKDFMKLIESKEKQAHEYLEPLKGKAASYIPIVSATGELFMSIFVLPMTKEGVAHLPMKLANPSSLHDRHSHPVYFAFTESGWVTAEVWKAILPAFRRRLDVLQPGLHACILMDNLAIHLTHEVLSCGMNDHIYQVFFPAHTSHFLQPCDDLIFRTFKLWLYRKVVKAITAMRVNMTDLGTILVEVALDVIGHITKPVILSSWKHCGVEPWNGELILNNAKNKSTTTEDHKTEVGEVAKTLATSIIKDLLGPPGDPTFEVQPKARGNAQTLFSGEEILKLKQQRIDDSKEKAAKKQETKVNKQKEKETVQINRETAARDFSCRGSNHDEGVRPVWKGSSNWLWCSSCDEFGICPKCLSSDREMLKEHEESHNDGMSE